jgi:protein-arginine kinase activator protein McsA
MEKLCERCEEQDARVRLAATDLNGTVLDLQLVCVRCAGEAGFTTGLEKSDGKGGKKHVRNNRFA